MATKEKGLLEKAKDTLSELIGDTAKPESKRKAAAKRATSKKAAAPAKKAAAKKPPARKATAKRATTAKKTAAKKMDRKLVSGMEAYEVEYLMKKFGVTRKAVQAAINAVGSSRAKVERVLKADGYGM